MKECIFEGSAVALVTPFSNNKINYEKLGELIEYQINNGTDAIVICGSTGEASTLNNEEHLDCLKYAVKKANKRVPIIAGVGSNDTEHAVYLSKEAEKIGVNALLSVVPYYNKPTQKGIYEHFKAISKNVHTPIILYNVPSRTSVSISPQTVKELAKLENIVGIKECIFNNVGKHIKNCPSDFSVYSGEDGNVLATMALGAKGVVSVVANIMPREMKELTQCVFDKKFERAQELQLNILDLVDSLFCEPSPAPIKEAMNYLGMDVGVCRLPLVEMSKSNKENLIEVMKKTMDV